MRRRSTIACEFAAATRRRSHASSGDGETVGGGRATVKVGVFPAVGSSRAMRTDAQQRPCVNDDDATIRRALCCCCCCYITRDKTGGRVVGRRSRRRAEIASSVGRAYGGRLLCLCTGRSAYTSSAPRRHCVVRRTRQGDWHWLCR